MICPRCGKFSSQSRNHLCHYRVCKRIPKPDELAAMLDDNTSLTVSDLRKRYGTNAKFIKDRLKGTRWTYKRLNQRGKVQQGIRSGEARNGQVYTSSLWRSRKNEPRCPRCDLLTADGGMCPYCPGKVAAISARELTKLRMEMMA